MHELVPISLIGVALGLPLCVVGRLLNDWNRVTISLAYGVCILVAAGALSAVTAELRRLKGHVFIRSFFLGWAFSCGTLLITGGRETAFGLYTCILTHFHFTEFLTTAVINPSTLSLDSFLLNHSAQYGIAAAASWVEFFLEMWFMPWLKAYPMVTFMGMFMCIGGEVLRKGAMLTAHSNFTHLVRHEKVDGHELITHGLYSFCRHPAYAGWFWWSLGTQVILVNPICLVGYTLASYQFFKDRIYYEEFCLHGFFPSEYQEYQAKVKSSGVPFVEGYIAKEICTPHRQGEISKNKQNRLGD